MGSLYNVSDQVTVTHSTGNINDEQVKPVIDNKGDSYEQGSHGHILIYSNYEEQTNGARNLWKLQMWAKTLNMRNTESFAVNPMFVVTGALTNYTQALQFHDYYILYVTGFAKRGLPHTSNLQSLTIHTSRLENDIDLKFDQK